MEPGDRKTDRPSTFRHHILDHRMRSTRYPKLVDFGVVGQNGKKWSAWERVQKRVQVKILFQSGECT